jgi:hypothetical protein
MVCNSYSLEQLKNSDERLKNLSKEKFYINKKNIDPSLINRTKKKRVRKKSKKTKEVISSVEKFAKELSAESREWKVVPSLISAYFFFTFIKNMKRRILLMETFPWKMGKKCLKVRFVLC